MFQARTVVITTRFMTLLKAAHVLCEKPIASNLKDAVEMFSDVRCRIVIFLEGMRLFMRPVLRIASGLCRSLCNIRRAPYSIVRISSRFIIIRGEFLEYAFKRFIKWSINGYRCVMWWVLLVSAFRCNCFHHGIRSPAFQL